MARLTCRGPTRFPLSLCSYAQDNLVDRHVLTQLRANLKPSPPSTDSEFIRRAYLDTIGILPTPAEARAFLADSAADKRSKLVDRLLERPEFVDMDLPLGGFVFN